MAAPAQKTSEEIEKLQNLRDILNKSQKLPQKDSVRLALSSCLKALKALLDPSSAELKLTAPKTLRYSVCRLIAVLYPDTCYPTEQKQVLILATKSLYPDEAFTSFVKKQQRHKQNIKKAARKKRVSASPIPESKHTPEVRHLLNVVKKTLLYLQSSEHAAHLKQYGKELLNTCIELAKSCTERRSYVTQSRTLKNRLQEYIAKSFKNYSKYNQKTQDQLRQLLYTTQTLYPVCSNFDELFQSTVKKHDLQAPTSEVLLPPPLSHLFSPPSDQKWRPRPLSHCPFVPFDRHPPTSSL